MGWLFQIPDLPVSTVVCVLVLMKEYESMGMGV